MPSTVSTKARNRNGIIQKYLWSTLFSHGMNPRDTHYTHWRPQVFWECDTSRNTACLDWMGKKERMKWKAVGCTVTKILHTGNRLVKLLTCKHKLSFIEKERWPSGQIPKPHGIYSQVQKPNEAYPARFKICLGWVTPFSFHFIPFLNGMSITSLLCLSHHCILGAHNLFLVLQGHRWRVIFPQNGLCSDVCPYLIYVVEIMRFSIFELMRLQWGFRLEVVMADTFGNLGMGWCMFHVGLMWIFVEQEEKIFALF